MDDELRRRLQGAARAHRPDRERMRARLERGMADERRVRAGRVPRLPGTPVPWLRIAGATAAVCGVLAAGTLAVTSAARDDSKGAHRLVGTAPPSWTAPARGAALPADDGPLRSGGSVSSDRNRYWAQSRVTVRTAAPLPALTVELRIAQTGGVNSTGAWRSLPVEDFAASVREEGGFLVYRWTLKPGRTAPAGTHTFAGQYNHAEGARDFRGDDYTARAGALGGQAAVGGAFTRQLP
ncbi:hypothetical protein [Streptomyces fulvorobeus]|uniref:Uncharacterized protein n=1 Tax=Streptomyces fulvorobeus TaxID=284028 RepID=A0A7J0C2V6_9ACTN|nr:hypothetical protein [Streptomyces fulvorobeus]NYE40122.1 hypothetical protein [Streptomyces fulvorobeus]GFM96387.1 hypothetical protein Sfulv_11980 [Streptomyces fulvorobeus]